MHSQAAIPAYPDLVYGHSYGITMHRYTLEVVQLFSDVFAWWEFDLPSGITGNTYKPPAACLNIAGLGSFISLWSELAVNSERHADLEPKEIPAGGQQCPFLVNYSLNNLLSNETEYVLAWGSPSEPHCCCSWGDLDHFEFSLHLTVTTFQVSWRVAWQLLQPGALGLWNIMKQIFRETKQSHSYCLHFRAVGNPLLLSFL